MYVNFNLRFECVNTKPKNCDIILEKQKCKYLMNKLCQNKKIRVLRSKTIQIKTLCYYKDDNERLLLL